MRNRNKKYTKMSEINVTPLVDIMLVLLIIFMVTAPMLTTGIPIDLPKAKANDIKTQDKIIDINIDSKGQTYLGSQKLNETNLIKKLKGIIKENAKIQIMISADRKASYGSVIEMMGVLKQAGFSKVGLKTDASFTAKK